MHAQQHNARTTTNHQSSSNAEQDRAPPAEKLTSYNPHLHDEDVEDNNMRPQQQDLVMDEEEKQYEEQRYPVVDNATLDFISLDTLTRIDTAGTFPDEYIF